MDAVLIKEVSEVFVFGRFLLGRKVGEVERDSFAVLVLLQLLHDSHRVPLTLFGYSCPLSTPG